MIAPLRLIPTQQALKQIETAAETFRSIPEDMQMAFVGEDGKAVKVELQLIEEEWCVRWDDSSLSIKMTPGYQGVPLCIKWYSGDTLMQMFVANVEWRIREDGSVLTSDDRFNKDLYVRMVIAQISALTIFHSAVGRKV